MALTAPSSHVNFSKTQPSFPILILEKDFHLQTLEMAFCFGNGTLGCGMYPAGKVAISRHLATPGLPQVDHTVGKLSADAGSLCSEV